MESWIHSFVLVPLLPQWAVLISGHDWEDWNSHSWVLQHGVPQSLVIPSILFNMYMKLLEEIIWQFRVSVINVQITYYALLLWAKPKMAQKHYIVAQRI